MPYLLRLEDRFPRKSIFLNVKSYLAGVYQIRLPLCWMYPAEWNHKKRTLLGFSSFCPI
uniref:Uncharacterized protein n=1 Tax=Neorickettsia risticii TaxID=950 RepID=G0Z0C3_NEORS|nr:hypothetical protein [Neorickettsia risticii]